MSTLEPGTSRTWPSVTTVSPGAHALLDDELAVVQRTEFDEPHLDCLIGLDDKQVWTLLAALHGLRRNRRSIRTIVQGQHNGDELPGPQRVVFVRERWLST